MTATSRPVQPPLNPAGYPGPAFAEKFATV